MTTYNKHHLTEKENKVLKAQEQALKEQAKIYGKLSKDIEKEMWKVGKASLNAIVSVALLLVTGATLGKLGLTLLKGAGDISAAYSDDDLSEQTMEAVHGLSIMSDLIEIIE
ncbi:MAG: hypothetical protein A2Y97_04295 [Nitrospirae bacterium RBG_13_39_12]|nr:MAG: hypothetical protein A2Y97_04295 [Nitrospirae bacterium RBG_13_39_12]